MSKSYLLRFDRSVDLLRVLLSSSSSSLSELELVDDRVEVVVRLRELEDDERLTLDGGVRVCVDLDLESVVLRCLVRSMSLLTRELERVEDEYVDLL